MKSGSRNFLWLGVWLGIFLVAATAAILINLSLSRKALQDYRTELIRSGESFNPQDFGPPPVPQDENNGGPRIITAAIAINSKVKPNSPDTISFGQKETRAGEAEVVHQRSTAYSRAKEVPWTEVESTLAPHQGDLMEIRQAARLPALATDLDYSQGVAIPVKDYMALLATARVLSADTMLQLRAGKNDNAADNIVTLLRLHSMAARHPLLICQLVATSIDGIAQNNTWEFLQAGDITSAQLQRLQEAWAGIALIPLSTALRLERAAVLTMFEDPQNFIATFRSSLPSAGGLPGRDPFQEAIRVIYSASWPIFYRGTEEHVYIENIQTLIDKVPPDQPVPWSIIKEASENSRSELQNAGLNRFANKALAQFMPTTIRNLAVGETLQSLTITALAIRRYQLDHAGAVPASLNVLIPQYLPALPHDPMDGNILRYKSTNDSFTLYSVGLNASDDGGNGSPAPPQRYRDFTDGKDLVWPRAAKPKTSTP